MTLIRYSLLSDETDSGDIKRSLLVAALCLLTSLLVHIVFFTAWQIVDGEASDNFHFVLLGETSPPIELVLTFGEQSGDDDPGGGGSSDISIGAPPPGGLFSPNDAWAENSMSGDFWGDLGRYGLENGIDGLPQGLTQDIQTAIPPSIVDGSLAQAELMPLMPSGTDEAVEEINPDPPISLEHQAPQYKSYYTLVDRAINSRWIIPPEAKEQFRPGRLTALVTIGKDGQLLRLVVQESSGNPTLDHAGLEALRAAAPFPPFPVELSYRDQVDIIIHFNYKADYKRSSMRK